MDAAGFSVTTWLTDIRANERPLRGHSWPE